MLASAPEISPTRDLGTNLLSWVLGCLMVYLALFGLGHVLIGPFWEGAGLLAVSAICGGALYSNISRNGAGVLGILRSLRSFVKLAKDARTLIQPSRLYDMFVTLPSVVPSTSKSEDDLPSYRELVGGQVGDEDAERVAGDSVLHGLPAVHTPVH